MKKTQRIGFFVILPVFVIVILAMIIEYLNVDKGTIIFVDEDESKDTELISQSDELNLQNSNEYKSWKSTLDTTFRSLYNGNQAEDLLALRPNMVILWTGTAFSKSYFSPRGHMYAIDDVHRSLRTGAPRKTNKGSQPASCWACKSIDVPRLV